MSNMITISTFLNGRVDKLKSESKHGIDAKELVDAALVAIHQTPALQTCTPQSIYISLKRAATLGLHPGTRGGCHLVPYRKGGAWEAQLIIGYQGAIALCCRGGKVKSIRARVVKAADEFEVCMGTDEQIIHIPQFQGGETTHVYAVAELSDGVRQFEVMTTEEVQAIRSKSKAGNSGPWKDHFDEMAKKTAVLRLVKYLPVSFDYGQDFDTPNLSPPAPVYDVVDTTVAPEKLAAVTTTTQEELRAKLGQESESILPAFIRKDRD